MLTIKYVACLAGLSLAGVACQSPSSSFVSSSDVRHAPVVVTPAPDCSAAVRVEPVHATRAETASAAVCPRDVIRWSRDGRTDEQILQTLEERRAVVPLTAADENNLRDAGVSETLIEAIKTMSRR